MHFLNSVQFKQLFNDFARSTRLISGSTPGIKMLQQAHQLQASHSTAQLWRACPHKTRTSRLHGSLTVSQAAGPAAQHAGQLNVVITGGTKGA